MNKGSRNNNATAKEVTHDKQLFRHFLHPVCCYRQGASQKRKAWMRKNKEGPNGIEDVSYLCNKSWWEQYLLLVLCTISKLDRAMGTALQCVCHASLTIHENSWFSKEVLCVRRSP
jgi:hypothetical protein